MTKYNRLREPLKKTSFSTTSLAKTLGLTRQAIALWDKNGIPLKRIPEISQLTGLSFHELRPDIYKKEQ